MFTITFPGLDNLMIQFDSEYERIENKGIFKGHPHFSASMTIGSVTKWFNYFSSVNTYDMGEKEFVNFLDCVLSDVSYSDYSIDDFFSELGYTKPSEAIQGLNDCKKEAQKITELGIYLLADQIREEINETGNYFITED